MKKIMACFFIWHMGTKREQAALSDRFGAPILLKQATNPARRLVKIYDHTKGDFLQAYHDPATDQYTIYRSAKERLSPLPRWAFCLNGINGCLWGCLLVAFCFITIYSINLSSYNSYPYFDNMIFLLSTGLYNLYNTARSYVGKRYIYRYVWGDTLFFYFFAVIKGVAVLHMCSWFYASSVFLKKKRGVEYPPKEGFVYDFWGVLALSNGLLGLSIHLVHTVFLWQFRRRMLWFNRYDQLLNRLVR